MHQQLSVDQLIQYVASETAPFPRRCYPAIVVQLEDANAGVINLTVFNDVTPGGAVARLRVPSSNEHQSGTWHVPATGAPVHGESQGSDVDLLVARDPIIAPATRSDTARSDSGYLNGSPDLQ